MPNTEIVRVFTREKDAKVADTSLVISQEAEVVVEVEASNADWFPGAQYTIGLTLKDLEDSTSIPATPDGGSGPPTSPATVSGSMQTAPWDEQAKPFVFKVAQADLGTHVDHLCEAHAYLRAGASQYEVSFAESQFLVTK